MLHHSSPRNTPTPHPIYDPIIDARKCSSCGRRDGWRRLLDDLNPGGWVCCLPDALLSTNPGNAPRMHTGLHVGGAGMTTNTNGGGRSRPTIPPKPHALQPIPENIPDELKTNTRFVMWAWEYRNGKHNTPGRWTKPPYTTVGEAAAVDDPNTWTDFETALAAYRGERAFDGFGWVLQESDGYTGIDLDKCVDPDGTIDAWARKVIQALNSYTEISPSGTGVRIIIRGTLPPGRRRKGLIEMYISGRYLTLTGHRVEGTPATIEERREAVAALHLEVFGEVKPPQTTTVGERPALSLDDAEVLERARRGKHGARFIALFDHGDWQGQGYDSQNEADAALCNDLRFWTGADLEQMDRLFRRSGLMREKWDERRGELTYGQRTITFTLNGAVYTPGSAPAPASSPEPIQPAQGETHDLAEELARLRAENTQLTEISTVQAARIAELEQQRSQDVTIALQSYNRAIMQVLTSEATPARKVSMIALAAEAHSNRVGNFLSLEGMAKRYNVGEDTLRTVRDTYAPTLFTVDSPYLSCSPYTGEVHSPPQPYSRTIPAKDSPAETLTAMVEQIPDHFKPAERPPRREKPQPEAPAETPLCPEDGEAPTVTTTELATVTRCQPCGTPLAAVVGTTVLVLPPEPTHPAQDPTPLPVVTGVRSPDSPDSGDDQPVRCPFCRAPLRKDGSCGWAALHAEVGGRP